jgi:effector-binding domain-containing protein
VSLLAAKAAQLAQWLKELQDKVNADGNIKYDDILLFTKEKSLTSKQLDIIYRISYKGQKPHTFKAYESGEMKDKYRERYGSYF